MKSLLFLISISSVLVCHAQTDMNVSLETNSGYEHNIFKFPSIYLDSNGEPLTGSDAYINSFYQRIYARLEAKQIWQKSELSLSVSPQTIFYYSESEFNYSEFFTKLEYQYDFKKSLELKTTVWYRLKNRDGLNADASDLAFPLGYTHYGIYSTLDFRWFKNNRSQFRLSYNSKHYDATETSDLSSNAFAGKYILKNIFKQRTGYHHYGIELNYSNKAFSRIQNSGTDNFTWHDAIAELFYKYPISKSLDMRGMLSYKIREDSNADRFSYRQIQPALHFRYREKAWDVDFTTSYTLRNYATIEATNSDDEVLGKLEYNYLRINLNVENNINDQLIVFLDGNFTHRNSNRTNINSIFFRSYDYANVSLGIRYRF